MKEGPFARALSYFPAVRTRWLKGMLCILPTSGLELVLPFIVRHVVNGMQGETMSTTEVVWWALAGLLITVVKGAGKFGMRWYITGASREFERIYRQEYFQHLMRLTPRDIAHVRTGDLMSRSVADVEAVRMMLGPGLMYVSQAAIVVPSALIVMATIDVSLTLVMLVPFIGLATVIRIAAKPTQHWSEATQERIADLSVVAHENFSGVRVVKAFATEGVSGSVFRRMGRSLLEANMRLATIRGVTSAAITAIKDLGALVILLVGGWHVVQGTLSVGDLVFFLMILNLALWPLIAIGWMLGMYHRAKAGARRLEEVFSLEPSVRELESPAPGGKFRGEIEVKDLSFGWGEVNTLEDISFKVAAGKTVGITGRTGCGKTTLVQLLARLVDPPAGTVFVDGRDIRELPLNHLRQHIGVVPQDTFLFSDTVSQNIAFAGPHIDEERVREVARLAQVHDDIEGFPDGFDELLGERGVTLSGGQRQRTAIARGLAANPPLLILDDCLSAVDSVTEQAILRTLRETLSDRTSIIVSHRVTALILADEILVMDEGRIVERGTHHDLVARGGLYADLEQRQRIEAEIDAL